MIDVSYYLGVVVDGTYLQKYDKLDLLPNKGEKIILKDLELIVEETTNIKFFGDPFYVVRLESIVIGDVEEFCKKYGFEKVKT